jgi:hypothetical protein
MRTLSAPGELAEDCWDAAMYRDGADAIEAIHKVLKEAGVTLPKRSTDR